MSYQPFKDEWLGRRVDFDHVYFYQCVDLIQQYAYENYGINGVYGNAIDYWTRTDPRLLGKFDKVGGSDAKQGDIVVLYGLSGNIYGHIGIAESQDASNITILEQNGATGSGVGTGGDAIRTRAIPKSRVAGLLRPKSAPIPPPTPNDPRIGKTLYLHAVPKWRVYRVGDKPMGTNAIGYLIPANYNHGPNGQPGLTYRIEGVTQWPNTVIIRTDTYGLVGIYVDNDGEIL
jgi:hypothetical protein